MANIPSTRRSGKRSNGEGCIMQFSDGRWQTYLTLGGAKYEAFYSAQRRHASRPITQR